MAGSEYRITKKCCGTSLRKVGTMLQLIYCLTGDNAYPPILDGQIQSYLNKIKQLLENAIWTGKILGRLGIAPLFQAYNALLPEAQAALLLSPDGFEAVWALAHAVTEER